MSDEVPYDVVRDALAVYRRLCATPCCGARTSWPAEQSFGDHIEQPLERQAEQPRTIDRHPPSSAENPHGG